MLSFTKRQLFLFLGILSILVLSLYLIFKKEEVIVKKPGFYPFESLLMNGKKVHIQDSLSSDGSKSELTITPYGFESNTVISLVQDRLQKAYFEDINKDGAEEVILIFSSKSGSSSAIMYTTFYDAELTFIEIPSPSLEEITSLGIFEGYLGGDTYSVDRRTFFREFSRELTEEEFFILENKREEELSENDNEGTASETTQVSTTTPDSISTDPYIRKKIQYALIEKDGEMILEPREIIPPPATRATSNVSLSETAWTFISINKKGKITLPENEIIELQFGSSSLFTLSSSCGTFNGSYIATPVAIRFGSIEESVNEGKECHPSYEEIKKNLPLALSFVVRGNQLLIEMEDRQGIILFSK